MHALRCIKPAVSVIVARFLKKNPSVFSLQVTYILLFTVQVPGVTGRGATAAPIQTTARSGSYMSSHYLSSTHTAAPALQ